MAKAEFLQALKVFRQNAPPVLDMTVLVRGIPTKVQLLDLLSLDDDSMNAEALLRMADALPAMLTFYGELKASASESVEQLEAELDLFIQRHWADAQTELIQQLDGMKEPGEGGKKIPSALKNAPTQASIRGHIIIKNRAEYDVMVEKITAAKRVYSMLSNIIQGIESRTKLLNGQLSLMNTLTSKGIV
jgi:hypothetical protein